MGRVRQGGKWVRGGVRRDAAAEKSANVDAAFNASIGDTAGAAWHLTSDTPERRNVASGWSPSAAATSSRGRSLTVLHASRYLSNGGIERGAGGRGEERAL